MKTLVTEQTFKFGQKNIIPFAGEVVISATGEIEVEDDVAQSVVDSDCGFSFKEAAINETTTTTTIAETTTTTTVEETTTTTTIDQINAPAVEDLGNAANNELGASTGDNLADQTNIDSTTTTTTEVVISKEDAYAELDKQNKAELQEIAKSFPRAEWGTLNKHDLIEYLISKL